MISHVLALLLPITFGFAWLGYGCAYWLLKMLKGSFPISVCYALVLFSRWRNHECVCQTLSEQEAHQGRRWSQAACSSQLYPLLPRPLTSHDSRLESSSVMPFAQRFRTLWSYLAPREARPSPLHPVPLPQLNEDLSSLLTKKELFLQVGTLLLLLLSNTRQLWEVWNLSPLTRSRGSEMKKRKKGLAL